MAWKKINEKKYQLEIEGEFKTIDVPYGKVEAVFDAFVGAGGMVDAEGRVVNDLTALIRNFGKVGDIMLTTYDEKGKVAEEGCCAVLSTTETIELFEVAQDVITGFIGAITRMQEKQAMASDEKAKVEKPKKTKTE